MPTRFMLVHRLGRDALCVWFLLGCLIACGDDDSSDAMPDAAALNDAASDADTDGDDGSIDESGSPDAGDAAIDAGGEPSCEQRREAFLDFLAQHQSCVEDDDCAVIGDCSPNADFRAIRADAAAQGYALMAARCGSAHDGPGYIAHCDVGTCALEASQEHCCGCGDWDGGSDQDAGH